MKILILPDIHGRDFWIEPCSYPENYDKIIFLGDYHDPYSFQVSQDKSRHQLRDLLVPYVEKYKDKVICLLGNHDLPYLIHGYCCRHDDYHEKEIAGYLKKMNLQLLYEVDGYLFSHSGVLPGWMDARGISSLNDVKNMELINPALNDISRYRGGFDMYGSPIWGDVREYDQCNKLEGYYQIFGHTQLQDGPIITNEFACLDCRKAFVLDTETKELKQYEYETPKGNDESE